MRAYVRGPSLGPVHTVLWSSGHRRRHVKGSGWLYLAIFATGGITWAYIAAPWIGILVSVLVLAAATLALYGILAAHRETRERTKDKGAGWKAEHVPASTEYREAHPYGPCDWEPAS